MLMKTNPNRMELLKLKKRLIVAKRGHKLLKDKRDALIQEFIHLAKESKIVREELEEKLMNCYQVFSDVSSQMSKISLEEALLFPKAKTEVMISYKNIMSVKAPKYKYKLEGKYTTYSMFDTPTEIDKALNNFYKVMPLMLRVAELDKTIILMADEIEKTRRRVNALEYILMPDLEETIKFITMKLDEMARSSISAIMRIKEIIRS